MRVIAPEESHWVAELLGLAETVSILVYQKEPGAHVVRGAPSLEQKDATTLALDQFQFCH